MNFIWKKKLDESKKNISSQLKGVSEAISPMANDIDRKEDQFIELKQEINSLLEQKEIKIKSIEIKQMNSSRYIVEVYTDICGNTDGTECDIKKISKILSKVLDQKMAADRRRTA